MDWLKNAMMCPVLKGVSEEELLSAFEKIQFQIRRFNKDSLLAVQGDEVDKLMILLEGSTRGEMTDFSGRVIKIEDIEAPRPLAGAFLFGHENRYPVDVIANEPVKVLIIYKNEFLKLLSMNSTIMMNYLSLVSSKAQFLSRKLKFLTFKSIKGKLAHYLIGLKPDEDGYLHIPVSQQDLADLFGVARPSVARAQAELEQFGIIQIKNRKVRIMNKNKLLNYLEE